MESENNMVANNSFIGQEICGTDTAFRFIQFKGGVVCKETENLAESFWTKSPKKVKQKRKKLVAIN